MELS
ncbi:hypothetical protein CP061683_0784A, partial [Chlamydia psittaci 06-1683]|jgi:hypothetical protein